MKVIAVSQKVISQLSNRERDDALDQQWTVLLEQSGLLPVPLPNRLSQIASFFDSLKIEGLLLTGGNDLSILRTPDSASERDAAESAALAYATGKKYPVLGVCRGAQVLVNFFGGQLHKVNNHAGTKHSLTGKSFRFGSVPEEVQSYHHFGFFEKDLPSCLQLVATSSDGVVEAFQHKKLPIAGVMWHPEREKKQSQKNLELLRKLFCFDL